MWAIYLALEEGIGKIHTPDRSQKAGSTVQRQQSRERALASLESLLEPRHLQALRDSKAPQS